MGIRKQGAGGEEDCSEYSHGEQDKGMMASWIAVRELEKVKRVSAMCGVAELG